MKVENNNKGEESERRTPLTTGQFESFLSKVNQGLSVGNENKVSAHMENNPDELLPIPEEPVKTEHRQPTEVPRRKRKLQEDYQSRFFIRVDFTYRKPLYITASTHRRLMRIVHLMDNSKATISSYVENILVHHLDTFKEDINTICQENSTNPMEE